MISRIASISVVKSLCCASFILFSCVLTVRAQRDPVDVMLVLDKSGSMSQSVPGLSMTQWDVLQESVQAFLEAYRQWGVDADRIGVTYFDHTRSDFLPAGMMPFNPPMNPLPLTGAGSIQQDMMSKSPGGATCMGGGILAGYLAFDNTHTNRNLILFTDGLQNMEPTVSESPTSYMVVNDYNLRPDGTGFPSPPLDLKNPALDFRCYTIAIGDNAVTGLLQDIAIAPIDVNYRGESFALHSMSLNLPMELQAIFSQTFVESLAEFSPQSVDVKRINGNTATSFVVNSTADKLLINIVSDPLAIREGRVRVHKDGRDFSRLIRLGGTTYRTFFIDSAMIKAYNVDLAGVWNVSISGASSQFQISCVINDESLKSTASIGHRKYAPGDSISLEAVLEFSGVPVTTATSATVLVARPGQDTNDLFALAATPKIVGNFPTEPGDHPGQSRYDALIAFDSSFVASLQPLHDTIRLSHAGSGRYAATFSDTEASGIYRFAFRIRGNDPQTGPYERFMLRSAVIDFGLPDESNTGFSIVTVNGKQYFQLSPKNKFGHFIGPNRLNQIRLAVAGKPLPLTDNLDGTYSAPVPETSLLNADPDVTVEIKGAEFYDDKLSTIKGNELTVWDKYWLWIILFFLVVLILIILVSRR